MQLIHPDYQDITITCVTCKTEHHVRSTLKTDQTAEVCRVCHPFWSGTTRIMDSAGRVERFNKRYARFKKV